MVDYQTKIEEIVGLLDQPYEQIDFPKTLELIIALRTSVLRDYRQLTTAQREEYNFLSEGVDRLYTCRFEQQRQETLQNITKEYRNKK